MLLGYNPFYQQLHQRVLEHVQRWDIREGDLIADVGAGTGNYSLATARQFPQAGVIHIDNDAGMNAETARKREAAGIDNHYILDRGIDTVYMAPETLRALVSIHALYTFPDPEGALKKMYDWLQPGGYAVLADAGRIVNVLSWQLAVGWHLLRHYGWNKTRHIMREGQEVSRQNAYIRDMQRRGEFWTHSHEEFCTAVRRAGFEILESEVTFRGVSDLVVARKP